MPVIRIFLLLVVLGGLTLLLGQNWSPVLPLVFLGLQTQALPLTAWILLSLAAGAITSLFISGLFKLANYSTRSPLKRRKAEPPPRSSAQRSETRTATSRPSPKPDTNSTPKNAVDDWGSNSTTNDDDWNFEENTNKKPNSNSPDDLRDSTTYKVSDKPKSSYQSGSYSYYQEPNNSSVGKTESIYDADYRVIAPPYRQPDIAEDGEDGGFSEPSITPNPATSRPSQPNTDSTNNASDDWNSDSNDDDWGFEEDTDKTPSSSEPVRKSTTYEVSNEPKSGYRAGSVYSYSYREARNSDVGTDSSAPNYPVTPPARADTTPDDDWGFEDDDDFEDKGDSDIKRR